MKSLRIWFGCSLGLALSMIFDWSYGFFAIMLPLFILAKMDRFNLQDQVVVIISVLWITLLSTLLIDLLHPYPIILTLAVGIMMLLNCLAMIKQETFLFGFIGILVGSISLSFASYNFIDIEDFNINLWVTTIVNIGVCALSHWLFPNLDNDTLQVQASEQVKNNRQTIMQVALGWSVVMCAFIIFQVADLYDSLSALVSVIIVIAPMTLTGAMAVAKVRIVGTAFGCLTGIFIQLFLGHWFSHGILFWLAATIGMGIFCHWQTQGQIKAAIGFSGMSALTVPLTTTLIPQQQDAFYSILYRFSSVFIAVALIVIFVWVMNLFLIKLYKFTAPVNQQA